MITQQMTNPKYSSDVRDNNHVISSARHGRSPSFKAPSRNANNQYEFGTAVGVGDARTSLSMNRSRTNFPEESNILMGDDDDICDETWPLDEVINKIDIKSDSETTDDGQRYNLNTNIWRTGPRLISENYDSGREMTNVPGGGQMISSFQQGSKVWKDQSVTHHKYKTKKTPSSTTYEKLPSSCISYDANNNYLGLETIANDDNVIDDDYSPILRDVGIQCNLKKYQEPLSSAAIFNYDPNVLRTKPPIKVIKSTNNGIVSTFSDVPKLPSTTINTQKRNDINLTLNDSISTIKSQEPNDGAIYSQVDKSHKNRRHTNARNINIVYKQPLNDSFHTTRSSFANDDRFEVKNKEFGFSVGTPEFTNIPLPNPINDSLAKQTTDDKEILEETISISNSSTDDSITIAAEVPSSLKPSHVFKPPTQIADNYSLTSKSSMTNYRKESPLRSSYFYDSSSLTKQKDNRKQNRKIKEVTSNRKHEPENDENVWLENNSLRLKSSKSPSWRNRPQNTEQRLNKSNADLREQFMRDETRGGLAAAYKNRQQKNQVNNRQRTLSLNRMNAVIRDHEDQKNGHRLSSISQLPTRHLSQTNLGSRGLSDLSGGYPRSSRTSIQHERDPIVMYIPPVNHNRMSSLSHDSPKLTSILRNNSTKSNATLQSSKTAKKQPPATKSQSKVNLKEITGKENQSSSSFNKKADLNRRYSMPKDTKFNWLQKLKLKSK